MKSFLSYCSRRFSHDGWALRVRGASRPLDWSVCTTREEARDLRRERTDLLRDLEIVKVRVMVETIEGKRKP